MKKLTLDISKIEKRLKKLKRTKSWLADEAGISRTALYNIFDRKGPLDYVNKFARPLGFSPYDLIK